MNLIARKKLNKYIVKQDFSYNRWDVQINND